MSGAYILAEEAREFLREIESLLVLFIRGMCLGSLSCLHRYVFLEEF